MSVSQADNIVSGTELSSAETNDRRNNGKGGIDMSREQKIRIPVGIDLGTTNTAAASLNDAGIPTPIKNAEGDYTTPSIVLFMKKDVRVVGREAKNMLVAFAKFVVREIKRVMGETDAEGKSIIHFVDEEGKGWTPEEISAEILKKIRFDIENATGKAISSVTVTVPAYFKDSERRATINAAKIAGFEEVQILDEPTAAALHYGLTKKAEGMRHYMVYDLGGGTFDVTIIKVEGGNVTAIATDGERNLGGTDWDERISIRVQKEAEKQGVKLDPATDTAACQEVKDKVERLKYSLSTVPESMFNVNIGGKQISFKYSLKEFETDTRDLLERTGEKMKAVLQAAGMSPDDIDDTILVGGATRMAMVPTYLTELMGKPPKKDADPDLVVCMGAAMAAGQMTKTSGKTVYSLDGKEIKYLPGGKFTNVAAHALGCAAYNEGRTKKEFVAIIKKNTALPAKCSERFALLDDLQSAARVEVFQGQEGVPLEKCLHIGDVELSGIPAGDTHKERITVTYEYSASCMVKVNVVDSKSGKSTNGEIKHQLGMSDEEVRKAKANAAKRKAN